MAVEAKDLLSNNFVRVNSSASVSEMLGALSKARQTHAVVFGSQGDYLGISSKHAVLRRHIDFSRVRVENIVEKKPVIGENTELQKIAELMIGSDSKILPVFGKKGILGVVFAADVIKQIKSIKEIASLPVREIASLKPVVLPFESTFGMLLNTMREQHVSKIPIVGKNNELKGIVSFSDLMESYLLSGTEKKPRGFKGKKGSGVHNSEKTDLLALPVSDWIISEVKTISPTTTVSKTIDLMLASSISDVVLAERNKVVGFVTLADLLECFVRLKRERKNIQFVNLPELDEIDAQFLNTEISDCFDKFKKVLRNINYFVVHFKFHESEGARRKATVHLRLSVPGKLFIASASGWILLDTVHDAVKILEREVFDSVKK